MKLKVINSNSSGNSYILDGGKETLLLELGVKFPLIKKGLNFDLSKVVSAIVTHDHLDHAKSIPDAMASGIDVYASKGTFSKFKTPVHRTKIVKAHELFQVGEFRVMPFDIKHDAEEPLGFLINHPESGNILFLTDTYYSPYTFKNLNNIIIETNYSQEIINQKLRDNPEFGFLRNRVLKSHMSLETCKKFLSANDLSKVNNIVLIHLSNGNSDEKYFKSEIELLTCKNVFVADAGVEIDFNKTPF